MSKMVYVGIAEYRLMREPGILACSALGSCVGVCLWDCETRLSGLLHVLLPSAQNSTVKTNPAKFADIGTETLVHAMESRGSSRANLRAKLAGGANMYQFERACAATDIGEQNIRVVRETLARLSVPVVAEQVGGEFGRSIRFDTENFAIRVDVLSKGAVVI